MYNTKIKQHFLITIKYKTMFLVVFVIFNLHVFFQVYKKLVKRYYKNKYFSRLYTQIYDRVSNKKNTSMYIDNYSIIRIANENESSKSVHPVKSYEGNTLKMI